MRSWILHLTWSKFGNLQSEFVLTEFQKNQDGNYTCYTLLYNYKRINLMLQQIQTRN